MRLLTARWPGLRALPHEPVASLPTSLGRAEGLAEELGAEVLLKREDRSAPGLGGCKVRKLAMHLGAAREAGADTLVTFGPAGSQHVLTTALLGAQLGHAVHAVLLPERWSEASEGRLRVALGADLVAHPTRSALAAIPQQAALVRRLKREGRRPYVVPLGASGPTGALGFVEVGLELARQLEAPDVREPDAIFVPLGTGGTAAGLAVGLAAAGIAAPLVCVRATRWPIAPLREVRGLIARVVATLRAHDDRFPLVAAQARALVELDQDELGPGYGRSTAASRRARSLLDKTEGISLDPAFGAKAMASLLRRTRLADRPLRSLFVHTGIGADLTPAIDGAPGLPYALRQLFRVDAAT